MCYVFLSHFSGEQYADSRKTLREIDTICPSGQGDPTTALCHDVEFVGSNKPELQHLDLMDNRYSIYCQLLRMNTETYLLSHRFRNIY